MTYHPNTQKKVESYLSQISEEESAVIFHDEEDYERMEQEAEWRANYEINDEYLEQVRADIMPEDYPNL